MDTSHMSFHIYCQRLKHHRQSLWKKILGTRNTVKTIFLAHCQVNQDYLN